MSANVQRGDDFVFLLDREHVTVSDIANTGDDELVRMAHEWLDGYSARFFLTVARNYQPIADSNRNTFDSHDDSVLFPNAAALLAHLPALVRGTPNALWVILARQDIEDTVRAALTAIKPN